MKPTYQRTGAALAGLAVTALALVATPGRTQGQGGPGNQAQQTLVMRGAGNGHGVGLSQQGTLGYARHGVDYTAILGHYFSGTALRATDARRTLRVLLQGNARQVSFSGAGRANGRRLRAGASYTAILRRGRLVLRLGRRTVVAATRLRVTGRGPLTLAGRADNGIRGGRYRGALEVRTANHGGGLDAIDVVSLEPYVRGVVASEVPAQWPPAALDAQAVASRTYAITAHDGPAGTFDLYSDTRSQVYGGVASETPSTDAAVAATAGQVVTYGGQPAITYFFDSSGGQTENVENAFPGSPPAPWLRAVADPYEDAPADAWGPLRISFADATRRLHGLVQGGLIGIEVLRRGASPRIVSAAVLGSAGNTAVSGPQLASRLRLSSTWAYFSVDSGQGEQPEPDLSGQPRPLVPGSAGPVPPGPGTPPPAAGAPPTGGTAAG